MPYFIEDQTLNSLIQTLNIPVKKSRSSTAGTTEYASSLISSLREVLLHWLSIFSLSPQSRGKPVTYMSWLSMGPIEYLINRSSCLGWHKSGNSQPIAAEEITMRSLGPFMIRVWVPSMLEYYWRFVFTKTFTNILKIEGEKNDENTTWNPFLL